MRSDAAGLRTAVLAAILLAAGCGNGAATGSLPKTGPGQGAVVARINDIFLTREDLDAERRMAGLPHGSERDILDKAVENRLLEMAAARTGVEELSVFAERFRGWQKKKAGALLGIEWLRRYIDEREGTTTAFREFYPRWRDVYFSQPEGLRGEIDRGANRELDDRRRRYLPEVQEEELKKFAGQLVIDPDEAAAAVAATTRWGNFSLAEVLRNESRGVIHIPKQPEEVLEMWRGIIFDIVAGESLYRQAEEEGLFEPLRSLGEEERERRRIMREVYLDRSFADRIKGEMVLEEVEKNLTQWTESYSLEADYIFSKSRRTDLSDFLAVWKRKGDDGVREAPPGFETPLLDLPLSEAWKTFPVSVRKVVIKQRWDQFLLPFYDQGGFWIVRITAGNPPEEDLFSLERIALQKIRSDLYREVVSKLRAEADIEIML